MTYRMSQKFEYISLEVQERKFNLKYDTNCHCRLQKSDCEV